MARNDYNRYVKEKKKRDDCDYYMLFVEHNYFVYRILEDSVVILEIFNEKEDFVYQSLVL